MGSTTYFYDKMTIEPPLTWQEIKQSEAWEGHPQHRRQRGGELAARRFGPVLHVLEREAETDEGIVVQRTCAEFEIVGDDLRMGAVLEQLRGLARLYGATHTFHGWFDARGDRDGDAAKVKIVGTEVVVERPVPLWPGDGKAAAVLVAHMVHLGWGHGEASAFATNLLRDLHDALSGGRS